MHTFVLITHVVTAAIWLGAGVAVGVLASLTSRQVATTGTALPGSFEKLGNVLFMPMGILVLISGVILVLDSPWKFTNLFVIIGILAVVNGAIFGARVSGPMTKSMQQATSDGSKLGALYRRFGVLALVDAGVVAIALISMILRLGS
jgi:uncharacterized membrane protein